MYYLMAIEKQKNKGLNQQPTFLKTYFQSTSYFVFKNILYVSWLKGKVKDISEVSKLGPGGQSSPAVTIDMARLVIH